MVRTFGNRNRNANNHQSCHSLCKFCLSKPIDKNLPHFWPKRVNIVDTDHQEKCHAKITIMTAELPTILQSCAGNQRNNKLNNKIHLDKQNNLNQLENDNKMMRLMETPFTTSEVTGNLIFRYMTTARRCIRLCICPRNIQRWGCKNGAFGDIFSTTKIDSGSVCSILNQTLSKKMTGYLTRRMNSQSRWKGTRNSR